MRRELKGSAGGPRRTSNGYAGRGAAEVAAAGKGPQAFGRCPMAMSGKNRYKFSEVTMSDSEKTFKGLGSAGEARSRPKRPYHKPTVRYERVFEVQALTCGKVQTTQGSCHANRKTS